MFLELTKRRRSIRKFTEEKVTEKQLHEILYCALRIPTAKNRDVVQYIVIDDRKELEHLATYKAAGAQFLAGCSVAVAVISDKEEAQNTYHQDACIAAIYLQLAATDLGLGSCWANVTDATNKEGRSSQEVLHEMLHLPDRYNVECIIGIGHIGEEKGQKEAFDFATHVHMGKFHD